MAKVESEQKWIDQIWAKTLSREQAQRLLAREHQKGNITEREFKQVTEKIQTSLR